MRRFLAFCLIVNAVVVRAQDWEEPKLLDPHSDNVEFSPDTIIMDEENTGEVIIAIINYKGDSKATVNFMVPPNGNEVTGLVVRKNDETYWELVVTQRQDYESGVVRFDMQIVLNSKQHMVSLQIRNIDDNPPVIIAEQSECKIEEDTLDDSAVNCFYKVRDEDGNLGDITWVINGEEEQNIFKFEPVQKPPYPESQKEMTLKLGLKQKLDFKLKSMHIIDFAVMDTASSTNLRIVVQVIDIPNQLPVWNSISHSEQFDEKTSQEFTVEAKDGDTDINDAIVYSISFPEEDWKHYISIGPESGKIAVKPIDRDAEEREIYKFMVKACEKTWTPDACIEQGVTFIINDVNDNAPTFTLDPIDGNVLKIEENRMSTINTTITVRDRDMGENARYTLRLTGEGHEEAFSVAPTSGYQQSVLDLFIVNFALLDYDRDDTWRKFTFELEAVERIPSHLLNEPVTFTIELINRNDELPIFQACNDDEETLPDDCVIRIEETFPGNAYLVTMVSEDADVGGSVEHTLLGAYANRILRIDSETGEIFTQNLLRPFDYETLSEVIVQVQAKDSLPGDPTQNIVLGQLTIKLIDVNDETPRISVEKNGDSVEENRPDGYNIGTEIIATDEDSMAELEVYIDWDKSDGIKNGVKITDTPKFQKYKGCVELDIDQESLSGKHVKANLIFKEIVKDNTPDFEIFDTLDLLITAIDTAQPEGDIPNKASIKVQVYITNLNDMEPEFTDSINNERKVNENTCPDDLIGIISATDGDADADLTYSLEPRNGTEPGLVKIHPKLGELVVDGSDKCDSIDADKPIWYLYYTVIVTDGLHITSAKIEIYVVDVNDLNPRFDRVDEVPPITITIDEQYPDGDDVETFIATDGDRDEENNKVTYSISTSTSSELRSYFKIDDQTGRVYVSYADPNQKLDRDNGIPPPPITIVIDAKDSGARSGSLTFTVELRDINNNKPVLKTEHLSIGEESEKDAVFSSPVTATDDDEANNPNSYISFEITSIDAMGNNKEGDLELFVLKDANIIAGTVSLVAGKKLRGYYDDYKISVTMSDHGTPQQINEGSFVVTINKYNFENPIFKFPSAEEIQRGIYLSKSQVVDTPILKHGGDPLESLLADDQQGNKFQIKFSVEDETKVIDVLPSGYLTVTKSEGFDVNTPFDVIITATIVGQPSTFASITVKMMFVDENITPVFKDHEFPMTEFQENTTNQEFEFPEAVYETGDLNLDLSLYYLVETKESPFTIRDNQVPKLYLEGILDREEQARYTVVVQASNRETGSNQPDPLAQLTIEIELQDINDNPPNFEADKYYTIFHYDDIENFVMKILTAHDLDDGDTLTYTITSTNTDHAIAFPTFDVDSIANSGHVKLTKDASSSAAGYATLTITVEDGEPDHATSVPLEVYVVSQDKHIVRFKFHNDVTEVEDEKANMIDILTKTFASDNGVPYDPNIRRSTLSTDDGDETPTTITEIYFIDTENHKPLEKTEIEMLANDINTYVRLEQQFQDINLYLVSFSTINLEPDNTVEVLRAWLIGVAVVLGSLCVLLIVAFVLKTRSLTKRLNKLSVTKYGSQESGLNRKVVPNTNRHALEGSNPVFSIEKKPQEFDQASIGSGDSDLIGVEDNPDFQRKPETNGIKKY